MVRLSRMWTNRNSSDYTKRLQDRVRFSGYIQSQQSFISGNTNQINIDAGSGRTKSASEVTFLKNGQANISAEEYSTIVGTPSYSIENPTQLAIISFTTVGSTSWIAPHLTRTVEYLVVGGGGGSGGGYDTGAGGGGGAGLVLSGTISVTPGNSYTITVGDGGTAGTVNRLIPTEVSGGTGETSIFGSVQAAGGSGGFGSRLPSGFVNGNGGAQAIEPNSGGGGNGGGSNGGGGGGGGNGSAGGNKSLTVGGSGGSGIANSITGSSVIYGAGGNGGTGALTASGVAGTNNTGNGAKGGSGASGQQGQGAKGGSGIIVLKYYY